MRRNSVTVILRVSVALCFVAASSLVRAQSQASKQQKSLALVGGTLIDLTNFGNSKADLKNAVVIVDGDRIVAVGRKGQMKIPAGAHVVDITGKYVVPGLTDGFASMNSQAHANAYLYMGVTGIVSKCDVTSPNCTGNWFGAANPSPRLYLTGGVGWRIRESDGNDRTLSEPEILERIEAAKKRGARRIFPFHGWTPSILKFVVPHATKAGLGSTAELSVSSYDDAIAAGVQSFIHTQRYSRELAPPEMKAEFIKRETAPPDFYKFIANLDPNDERVRRWAKRLAESKVALMPTLALFNNFLPVHDNPWEEPIASIIDPKSIIAPLDRETGKFTDFAELERRLGLKPEQLEGKYEANIFRIEEQYRKAGARYLVGSGTFIWGTMPGISTHTEMKLLVQIGLTPRQAIAAATNNFAEVFGWKEMGLIAAGRIADVVVVDENPVLDIANMKKIHMVVLRGEILDRNKFLRK